MLNNRKLPIGIQDFEDLRTNDYLYVDKTSYIYQLKTSGKPYFLSRPRRFGKSLFLSTLKSFFLGKKELFDGLAIAELEKDWLEYPVFYIDLNEEGFINVNSLYYALDTNLKRLESEWDKDETDITPASRLSGLIRRAYKKTGHKVVVLVDEYDKPLLNTLDKAEVNKSIHEILKGFYGVLKSADAYLRFVFLTGVTKFSKISVFSDLNNLVDISLDKQFSAICGISETELVQYFEPELKKLSGEMEQSYEETLAKLKKHYNGYHFSRKSEGMYNPFSLLNTLQKCYFNNYWFSTGTPTFLAKMLQEGDFEIPDLENNVHVSVSDITNYKAGMNNPIPILYQSGYLTIKDFDTEFDEFILGFPNEEVKYSFLRDLLPAYAPQYDVQQKFSAASFIRMLRSNDINRFMDNLRAFYAGIPYDMIKKASKSERYYQFIFYLLVTLMGQYIQTEVKTATGRVDAVIKTADTIFVFEFKMANYGTAESALEQIDSKDYLIPYTTDGRKIVKIGAEFSEQERGLSRWKIG
ncbi:MAG: ATP-binding protein [Planctomycetaceae bacterium]|nr:ATP-binding protein [Planctomycetaceae bacterium]